jgi:hypothetical protein
MKKWGRPRQKLFEALCALVGPKPLRLRLTYAADALIKLQPADFPVSSRETFKELTALLTQTPLSSSYGYKARTISPKKAENAAKTILELYVKVSGGL